MYFRFIMSDAIHGAGMHPLTREQAIKQLHQRGQVLPNQTQYAIEIKEENQGTLTSLANRYGKSPLEMAYYIKQHHEKFDAKWQRRATFCINASKWKKGKR